MQTNGQCYLFVSRLNYLKVLINVNRSFTNVNDSAKNGVGVEPPSHAVNHLLNLLIVKFDRHNR